MATVTAISIGLALLILAVLAITVGVSKSDKAALRAKGGPTTIFVAALAYLIVLTPVITPAGITGVSMILLVVLGAGPAIIAGLIFRLREGLGERARLIYDAAGVIVSFALLTGILATAGDVLSLFGGVNRYLAVAAIGLGGAGYLYARGRESSTRTSRWTIVIAFIVPVLLLLLGAALGTPSTLANSMVPSTPVPLGTVGALLVAVLMVAMVDPTIGSALRASPKPGKAALWGAVITAAFALIFSLGLVLVFGGAFVAPTLQAFLLAAAPVIAIGYFMFMAAFVLASAGDSQLAAGSELAAEMTSPDRRRPITFVLVVLAIVVAMFIPATGQIFVIAAFIAAAAAGAVLPASRGDVRNLNPVPGVICGLVAGALFAAFIGVEAALAFRGATLVTLLVAFYVSAAVSMVFAKKAMTAKPVPA